MREKLVSVIMGVYNCEHRIRYCIDSIKSQIYTNWELIICDDCSTDNTYDLLTELEREDSRIRVIRNTKNSKLAFSLNRCLEIAKGDYIARIDDDDVCYPLRFSKQVAFLENNSEYDVVGSWADIYDGYEVVSTRKSKRVPEKNDLLWGPCHMHPTIMMRSDAYKRLNGYVVSSRTERGQDWDLWFRFYAMGMKGYNLPEALIRYHESKEDKKKRTLKTAWMYTRTAFVGYRLIGVPIYNYVFAFKPLISAIMPDRFLDIYHGNSRR